MQETACNVSVRVLWLWVPTVVPPPMVMAISALKLKKVKLWDEFCFCPIKHIVLPDNHLKSSLKELQILFPDLIQCNDKSKMLAYKSGSILFSVCNGIVCKQYYTLDKYKNEVLERVYHGFVNSFKGYDSSKKSKSGKDITFYYPEYSVHIQYKPQKHLSVTYELNPEYYK